MSNESDDDPSSRSGMEALNTTAIGTAYKVLGDIDDSSDAIGVLGRNTAGSGATRGVEGRVNSPDGFGLYTPNDARVEGTAVADTIDTPAGTALRLHSDAGTRALELGVPGADGDLDTAGATVVAGHPNNTTNSAVGATIGGGGSDGTTYHIPTNSERANHNEVFENYGTVGGGQGNRAGSDDGDPASGPYVTVGGGFANTAEGYFAVVGGGSQNTAGHERATISGGALNTASAPQATVGGGRENTASDWSTTVGGGDGNTASGNRSTVGGGDGNTASGDRSTVGGGDGNTASGDLATVGGGEGNTASGTHATVVGGRNNAAEQPDSGALGRGATAQHEGAWVFGDSTSTTITSSNADEVRMQHDLYAASTNSTSARSQKVDVDPVDPAAVLSAVEDLTVSRWTYEWDAERHEEPPRHLGPMAGDFHEAFGVGNDEKHITGVDADGVALAGIQGLAEKLEATGERIRELEAKGERIRELEAKAERIRELEAETESLREEVGDLRAATDRLRGENADLRDRLAAVEAQVGRAGAPADD